MKRLFFLTLVFCLCFFGFAQSSRQVGSTNDTIWDCPLAAAFDNIHWITRPMDRTITVTGIAGRKRNRDEAIADALADAARRASLYHGVSGEATAVLQEGSNILDYFAGTEYSLNIHHGTEAYIDSLVFTKEKDVYEKNGVVYVRARYAGVAEIPAYRSGITGGVPDWVKEYRAEIPGFLAGIGFSKNKGSPQKTYEASYENAITSLLYRLFSTVEDTSIDLPGQGRVNQNITRSKGTLTMIMILETWFDKKTGAAWTLLAAKEG